MQQRNIPLHELAENIWVVERNEVGLEVDQVAWVLQSPEDTAQSDSS
jgi:hypothetical protein